MSNFPVVMNPTDLASALAQSQVNEVGNTGGFAFLKCDFESGDWSMGKDAEIVTDETMLVNTTTFKHGWTLWSGGRPHKLMVPFTQALPMPMENVGDDYPMEARSVEGAMTDDQTPVLFDTNSYGGRKGMDVLLGAVKAKAATGSVFLFPKVKLTSESYANKKRGGKATLNPVFEVVGWCDQEGNEETSTAKIAAAPVQAEMELPEGEPRVKRQRRSA